MMLMGRIVKPQGLKGELRLKIADDWRSIELKPCRVIIKDPANREIEHEIVKVRSHGGLMIIKLKDIHDRNQAEELRGSECFIPKENQPETHEGFYFDHELIGLRAETTAGVPIGTVREVMHGPAQDIYVIQTAESEVLIPAVDAFINKIDVVKGILIIDPIEGLL